MMNESTDIENAFARISYWLSSFGESINTLNHATDCLNNLKEEIEDETVDQENMNNYIQVTITRIKSTKQLLERDKKSVQDSVNNLNEVITKAFKKYNV